MLIEALTGSLSRHKKANADAGDIWNRPSAWTPGWGSGNVFAGRTSRTGRSLSKEEIFYCSVAWRCMHIIAESIAKTPVYPYREYSDGTAELARSHSTYKLLTVNPTPRFTPFEYLRTDALRVLTYGASYSYKRKDGNQDLRMLQLLDPFRMAVEVQDDDTYRFHYTKRNGDPVTFPQSDIHWVMGSSLNGINGMSICQAAMDAIERARAYEMYAAGFFRDDAIPPAVLKTAKMLSPEARDQVRTSFEGTHAGPGKKWKIGVLDGDWTLEPVNLVSNRDAELIEQMKRVVLDIIRFFGVPAHKVAELDRSTNNNITQQALEFYTDCLDPWLTLYQQSMRRDFFREREMETHSIEFDVDSLIWVDIKEKYETLGKAVLNSMLTPNEARSKIKRNPEKGGDSLLVPTTHVRAEDMDKKAEAAAEPAAAASVVPAPNPKDEVASLVRTRYRRAFAPIFEEAARRMVGREVDAVRKAYKKCAKDGSVSDLYDWAEQFYNEKHVDELKKTFAPSVKACSDVVEASTVGVDLVDDLARRLTRESKQAITDVLDENEGARTYEALEALVADWSANRATAIAQREVLLIGEQPEGQHEQFATAAAA